MKLMPGRINDTGFGSIRSFKAFDDRYTAPIHGFSNVKDYWSRSSGKQYLSAIDIPTLLISAQDDPFLPPECYPVVEADSSRTLFLEMPVRGGHAGFVDFNPDGEYWHERRVAEFLTKPGVLN